MLKGSAVHGASLMDLMIGDNGTAQVTVQKEYDSAVKLRVVPQLQNSGRFGIVFQMARIRKLTGKILQLHSGIVHDVSVDHSGIVRGSDTLCGNGNPQDLFLRIVIVFDEIPYLIGQLSVIFFCIGIGKSNSFCVKSISI